MVEMKKFRDLVTQQVEKMFESSVLFISNYSKDGLWELYLQTFPEDTNPIHKERTEHDCSTCKQFVRGFGNVVTVSPQGSLQTVWDGMGPCKRGTVTLCSL